MDKLAAARTFFEAEGMLESASKSGVPVMLEDDDEDAVDGQPTVPRINLAVKPFRTSASYFTCRRYSLPTDRTSSFSSQSYKTLQPSGFPKTTLALHDVSQQSA